MKVSQAYQVRWVGLVLVGVALAGGGQAAPGPAPALAWLLPGMLLGGLLGGSPGKPHTAPASATVSVPAPAAAPTPALLNPGQVHVAVYASSKNGLPGRYIYSPRVRWVSYLAVGPDGSLYFDAGPGGSGYPLVRVTPTGHVTALAYPAVLDPRHGMHYDFGPLAVTPQGRVYVLYRGLCEVQGPQQVRCPPLRDAQGRVLSDAAYPNLQYLATDRQGQVFVSDGQIIWRLDSANMLHVIQTNFSKSMEFLFNPWHKTPGYQWTGAVFGPGRFFYVIGMKLPEPGKKLISRDVFDNIYRISMENNGIEVELLLSGKGLDLQGSIATDTQGNLYVGSKDTIYKLSPD